MQEACNCCGLLLLHGDADPQQSRVPPSGTCSGKSRGPWLGWLRDREPWLAGLALGPARGPGVAGARASCGLALCCPSSALAEGRLPTGGVLRWFWDPQTSLGPQVVWKCCRCELEVP